MHVRRRGGEVIVINPVIETGHGQLQRSQRRAQPAVRQPRSPALYVQPHIGGDLALLTGIAKRIDEMQASDDEFLHESLRRLART